MSIQINLVIVKKFKKLSADTRLLFVPSLSLFAAAFDILGKSTFDIVTPNTPTGSK